MTFAVQNYLFQKMFVELVVTIVYFYKIFGQIINNCQNALLIFRFSTQNNYYFTLLYSSFLTFFLLHYFIYQHLVISHHFSESIFQKNQSWNLLNYQILIHKNHPFQHFLTLIHFSFNFLRKYLYLFLNSYLNEFNVIILIQFISNYYYLLQLNCLKFY